MKRIIHKIIYIVKNIVRLPMLFMYLRKNGIKQTWTTVMAKFRGHSRYVYREVFDEAEVRTQIESFRKQPLISVIMPVYNVDPSYLNKAIDSVKNQMYLNWELCIADDCSTNEATKEYLRGIKHPLIKISFLKKNSGISAASNKAASLANGEYIALLDNDDELTRDALFEVVKVINEHKPDLIYSDEDFINKKGKSFSAHFKPDYSPDLLLNHNYITHLLVLKKRLFDSVKGFSKKYDGAQDYDLVLKAVEKTKKIYHIPKVLYHWRMLETSTSYDPGSKSYAHDAGRSALQAALKRRKITSEVLGGSMMFYYRVKRNISKQQLVSIIIPFKDKPGLLTECVNSIVEKTGYSNYEIIGVNNNSTEKETFHVMNQLAGMDERIQFYDYPQLFNFSAINNFAAKKAKGAHLLFLNNDIEIIQSDWLYALLEHSQRKEVGAVGGKLYFPNKTIQHAGVIIGINGFAGHSHKGLPADAHGYFGRPHCVHNVSAVTGAMLMIKKKVFEKINGFDETFAVAFNDIDLCLRLIKQGCLNIFTPYCEAIHHESVSRGSDKNRHNSERFENEKEQFIARYREFIEQGDPYYNPNLSLRTEKFYYRND